MSRGDRDLTTRPLDRLSLPGISAVSRTSLALDRESFNRQRPYAQAVTECCGQVFKLDDLERVRFFVNAVKAGHADGLQVRGHCFVGSEHELLDEAMGNVALGATNGNHFPEFVKFDDRFGQVEINGAASLSLLIQD